MPLAVKKKQERTIARCGNSSVLYLPKGYFVPGETVTLDLDIDFDGNLKLTLKKCLFHFNCDKVKAELKGFKIVQDETASETRNVKAIKGSLRVNCVSYMQELEPTYVTVCRLFNAVNSAEGYTALTGFLEKFKQTCPDAYIEPEGDIEAIKMFKDPKRYHLEDEFQAVEFLRKTGKRLNYAVVSRFNSKRQTFDCLMQVLDWLGQSDEVLLNHA